MKEVKINTDYITLGQFLKLANAVSSGVEAKFVIKDGNVLVNNEIETRRGKKLINNDTVTYEGVTYKVIHED